MMRHLDHGRHHLEEQAASVLPVRPRRAQAQQLQQEACGHLVALGGQNATQGY